MGNTEALTIAVMATDWYRKSPDLHEWGWRNLLDSYVTWQMARDDEFWAELEDLVR